jgi:YbgC/YbaW family acyl-CoA thioester hydrolase
VKEKERDAQDCTEQRGDGVIALDPFTVRRTIRWFECDPGGVAAAGNYFNYVLGVEIAFLEHAVQASYEELRRDIDAVLPIKAYSLVFHASLRPNDILDMQLRLTRVGRSAFDLEVRGFREDGSSVFTAIVTTVCASRAERKAIAIPAGLRASLQRFVLAAQ